MRVWVFLVLLVAVAGSGCINNDSDSTYDVGDPRIMPGSSETNHSSGPSISVAGGYLQQATCRSGNWENNCVKHTYQVMIDNRNGDRDFSTQSHMWSAVATDGKIHNTQYFGSSGSIAPGYTSTIEVIFNTSPDVRFETLRHTDWSGNRITTSFPRSA